MVTRVLCMKGIGLEAARKSPDKEHLDNTVAGQDIYAIVVL